MKTTELLLDVNWKKLELSKMYILSYCSLLQAEGLPRYDFFKKSVGVGHRDLDIWLWENLKYTKFYLYT